MFVPNGTLPADEHVSIELPKFTVREERLNMPSVNFDIPYEKQVMFIDLINQEMEFQGASGKYTKDSFGRR